MPRLFVAVWPPGEVIDRLATLVRPEVAGLRWTRPDQWHVTLRFLGSVPDAAPVVATLDALASRARVGESDPPQEVLPEAGPEPSRPRAVLGPAVGRFSQRALYVPVQGLAPLAGTVVDATRALGHPPEHRPFAGHVTLARPRGRARVDLRPLAGAPISGAWQVEEVCLVESRLGRDGARYEVVGRFPLS